MRPLIVVLMLLLSPLLSAAERIKVVTSFSILADITREIGGDQVQVINIVGPDSDAHVYETTPDDARHVLQASLVVENGLNFEPWLDRLIKTTGSQAQVVRASQGILPRTFDEEGQTIPDPHAWNSLANAKIYAANIAKALEAVDADNAQAYRSHLAAYQQQIDALLAEVKKSFAALPANNRRIVTSHDAFGYLGQAYGIEFLAPQGLSTEQEPTAKDVASIISMIKRDKIKAVFIENIKDSRLMRQIADDTGAKIGGTLYSDALAAEGPASTYLGMYRQNVQTLIQALAGE
ncbi:TPA: metal ABC transporter substrate-binding protein [Pseudomonas putida]|uniref:metal ABC transporter substrate-binding protein n=1 Tax=Pseudomonas putida TaxID=303 RepID=UPI0023648A89|nr:metal ABC transporter substrate-binding protein [Pseudomonas putida]MDD2010790.1 metal ABC transporter substrate-binding protein [Pseudomonas putida]HDS1777189.1 metal ABC transporter substrate-binding protein [Pseudomonas putida]